MKMERYQELIVKQQELNKMAKFVFNLVYRDKDGEFVDDENVWVNASNKLEALSRVKEEYPRASSYTLIRSE